MNLGIKDKIVYIYISFEFGKYNVAYIFYMNNERNIIPPTLFSTENYELIRMDIILIGMRPFGIQKQNHEGLSTK